MSKEALTSKVAVLEQKVEDIKSTTDKVPKFEGRLVLTEKAIKEMWDTQKKILENTQTILLDQKTISSEIALLKQTIDSHEEETKFLREKLSEKANKVDLKELEDDLEAKADKADVQRQIEKIWRFLFWIPGAIAAVIAGIVSLFEYVKKMF